jgi:hypothetical protein
VTDDPARQDKRALYLRPIPHDQHERVLVDEAERTAAGHRFLTVEHPAGDKALVDELAAAAWRTERVRGTQRQDDQLTIEIHPLAGAQWARTADEVVNALEQLACQLEPRAGDWRIRRSAR